MNLPNLNDARRRTNNVFNKEIIDYKKLYEKLLEGISGTEYFEQEEIELIMSITKDKDFNYRVSLLQNIYYLNNEISKRRERLSK